MILARRKIIALALACGFINIAPLLFFQQGGDIILHYTLIQCFAEQFWQGDSYPRWCMEANDGLGSPVLMFYYPLPYYLTSLLYPLRYLGLSIEQFYIGVVLLISAATFATVFIWLRDICGTSRALLIAFILLWLPYRMELLYYRVAFAELCFLAMFPLWLYYARQLSMGKNAVWPKLSLALAAGALCNIPATINGLIGVGLYILIVSEHKKRALSMLALAIGGMAAVVAFYALPAKFLTSYLNQDAIGTLREVWANGYINFSDAIEHKRLGVYITGGLSIIITAMLGMWVWAKRHMITEPFIYRELGAWLIISIISFLLMFRISEPLWQLVPFVQEAITPWRMQSLIMFALVYFLATYSLLLIEKKMRAWKGDFAAATALLVLLAFTLTGSPPSPDLYQRAVEARLVHFKNYQTRWSHYDYDDLQALIEKPKAPRITYERNEIVADMWEKNTIAFHTTLNKNSVIKLRQFYFPTWIATDNGKPIIMKPDEKDGWITLPLPKGNHSIRIEQNIDQALPVAYCYLWLVSLAALIFLAYRVIISSRAAISAHLV